LSVFFIASGRIRKTILHTRCPLHVSEKHSILASTRSSSYIIATGNHMIVKCLPSIRSVADAKEYQNVLCITVAYSADTVECFDLCIHACLWGLQCSLEYVDTISEWYSAHSHTSDKLTVEVAITSLIGGLSIT
jgi:hypothetical protein